MKSKPGEISVQRETLKLVEDFANSCSLHGVKYMFKKDSTIKHRVVWTVSVVICIMCTVGVGSFLLHRYRMVPTVINVMDTHQPLYTFPFPTITVCSGTRVKRGRARQILSRYLPSEIAFKNRENVMLYTMSILSLLQYPNYNLMKPYLRSLEAKQQLHYFGDLNITDFMLEVMPRCEEVFHSCMWHGNTVNCCEVFMQQRTEEGFCWSFNSVTALGTAHCPLSEVLENEGVVEEDGTTHPECQLRRNTGTSTGSGLEIFLWPSDPRDNIGYTAQRVVNGISILVHTSYELPHAGTGVYAPNTLGSRTRLAVRAELAMSSDSIRSLPVEDRNCVFPDEQHLLIHHVYTEASCLIECRLKYIMIMCRCKLYFFNFKDIRLPDCGMLHLTCVTKHSDKFRFYRPPAETPGITHREVTDSMHCKCWPTCYDSVYDFQIHRSIPPSPENHSSFAHVDIFYSKNGFMRYQRQVVFDFVHLIGALGGVANLFLGFSVLSLIETIYWVYKFIIVVGQTYKAQKKIIQVHPIDYKE